MGPLRVAEALLGHVEASERKTLVMLSSRVASIASYDQGGRYFYRSAKAGLNALVKSLAVDLAPRGIVCIALSPGWVRTEMGGPDAPLSVTESVTGMRQVIDRLDSGPIGQLPPLRRKHHALVVRAGGPDSRRRRPAQSKAGSSSHTTDACPLVAQVEESQQQANASETALAGRVSRVAAFHPGRIRASVPDD